MNGVAALTGAHLNPRRVFVGRFALKERGRERRREEVTHTYERTERSDVGGHADRAEIGDASRDLRLEDRRSHVTLARAPFRRTCFNYSKYHRAFSRIVKKKKRTTEKKRMTPVLQTVERRK